MTSALPIGVLIGPYARQVTADKLKFWFAFVSDDCETKRYELAIDTATRRPGVRHRRIFAEDEPVPTHASNFVQFLPPSDLSALPSTPFPLFPKHRLCDASVSLLTGQDLADLTRVRMIGALPLNREPEWR